MHTHITYEVITKSAPLDLKSSIILNAKPLQQKYLIFISTTKNSKSIDCKEANSVKIYTTHMSLIFY